jgi:hypothetical protein
MYEGLAAKSCVERDGEVEAQLTKNMRWQRKGISLATTM